MDAKEYAKKVAALKEYNTQYRNGTPTISDAEYDILFHELRLAERNNPYLIDPESPTQTIGGMENAPYSKLCHIFPMYGLENIYSEKDLATFMKRFGEVRHQDGSAAVDRYYVDYKLDGLGVEIVYSNGRYASAISRGDGHHGCDITENVVCISNIPCFLNISSTVVVHGEVVVHKNDFYTFNREAEIYKRKPYATARSYAYASLMSTDLEVVKSRALKFYAWSVAELGKPGWDKDKQVEWLNAFGFSTPGGTLCTSVREVLSFVDYAAKMRPSLPYEIDGVVITQNSYKYRQALGYGNRAPLWSVAWKSNSDGVDTVIEDIIWTVGKTGRLTPVAKITPITINGVTISQCSLYNAEYIEKNEVGIGTKVHVIRAGETIPKIETILSKGEAVILPTVCPDCGTALTRQNTDLCCTLHGCPGRLIALLQYVASREVLDIRGMGPTMAKELVASGTIGSLIDCFIPRESKSKKVSQEFLDKFVKKLQAINLLELLMILGIGNVGRTSALQLAGETGSIHGLIDFLNDSTRVDRSYLNPAMKRNLKAWWQEESNRKVLKDIAALELPNLTHLR